MRYGLSRKRIIALVAYTVLFLSVTVWGVVLQFLPQTDSLWNYAYNAGSGAVYFAGGLLGMLFAANKRFEESEKKGLILICVALFLWATGSFIWTYFNFMGIEVPFPSLADIPYTGFSLYMMLALYFLINSRGFRITYNQAFLSLTAIVFLYGINCLLFWQVPPTSEATFLEEVSNFMYPMLESIIIASTLIAMTVAQKHQARALSFLLAGMIAQLVADYLFGYSQMLGFYWNGGFSDIAFVISGYLLTLSVAFLATDAGKPYGREQ